MRIGLALSGGGVRAVAYHAGVFQWLAERGLLERIVHLSTVSGGSLFAGYLYHFSGNTWPTSEKYLQVVLPAIESTLSHVSLQRQVMLKCLNPRYWPLLFDRSTILAKCLEQNLKITASVGDLPLAPEWSINGTVLETGHRFRVKIENTGSYSLGYTSSKKIPIAYAVAMSAAYPGLLGPLVLKTSDFHWICRGDNASELTRCEQDIYLHLYDGGVYDNLGIEPLFDIGNRAIRAGQMNVDYLIASDASSPALELSFQGKQSWRRIVRVAGIMHNQIRSLRVRAFVNFIMNNKGAGMYLQCGRKPVEAIRQYRSENEPAARNLLIREWLSDADVTRASQHRTDLCMMSESVRDNIIKHGYETAMWNGVMLEV